MESGGSIFSLKNKSLGGSKRVKISRACDECRKRKVKCDGAQPCGRCKKSNTECVFAKLPPKKGPPKQYMDNLENRLQRVEKALKSMAMPVRKIFEETEKKENNTAQQTQQREQLGHGTEIIANNNNIKAPSQSAPFSSMGNNSDITSFDRFAINEIGQALYINDIKERDDRIPDYHDLQLQQLQSDELSDITADSPISSTASFYVVASQPQSTSSCSNNNMTSDNSTHFLVEALVPDHLICSRRFIHEVQPLLEVYFDHVHKYLPMIHKPTFLKQLHSNYYGYSSVSSAVSTNHLQPPSKFLVYAMCAVAAKWAPNHLLAEENSDLVLVPSFTSQHNNNAMDEDNGDEVVRMRKLTETLPPGYSFYQKAIDLLDEFMDIPRTSTIQGILLLVKYQECFQRTGYFHRSHFYLGIAVQMCHDLGLTRSSTNTTTAVTTAAVEADREKGSGLAPGIGTKGDNYNTHSATAVVATSLNCDAEIKRRTFWVAFMMDLLMSIELGQAPYFNIQQCTTAFPMVTNEEGPALEELIVNQNIFIQLGKVLSDIYCTSRRLTLRQQIQGKHKTEEQMVEEQAKLFSLHTHLENFLYEVPPGLIYPPTSSTSSLQHQLQHPQQPQQCGQNNSFKDYYPVEKHPILDPYIGFLHITYHLSVILLHRLYVLNPLSETKFEFIGYPHQQLCATSASNITSIVQTLLETYPSYIFNYPIRGVQHVIHCLTMALSIHKYEMNHAENNSMKNAARLQHDVTVDMIMKLVHHSPDATLAAHYALPQPSEQQPQPLSTSNTPTFATMTDIDSNNDFKTPHDRKKMTRAEKCMSAPVYHHVISSKQQSPFRNDMYTATASPSLVMPIVATAKGRDTLTAETTPIIPPASYHQSSATMTDLTQFASLLPPAPPPHQYQYQCRQKERDRQQPPYYELGSWVQQQQQQQQTISSHNLSMYTYHPSQNQPTPANITNSAITTDSDNDILILSTDQNSQYSSHPSPLSQQQQEIPNKFLHINMGDSNLQTSSVFMIPDKYNQQQPCGYRSNIADSIGHTDAAHLNATSDGSSMDILMTNMVDFQQQHSQQHSQQQQQPSSAAAVAAAAMMITPTGATTTTTTTTTPIYQHQVFDPTSGLSQLFLSDDQQQQQQGEHQQFS